MFPIIFGLLTFVSTLLGGLCAIRYRKRFGILAAFAAGVLIAVSLFDLVPEALRLATIASVPLERVMYVTAVVSYSSLFLNAIFLSTGYALLTGHAPMCVTIRRIFRGC